MNMSVFGIDDVISKADIKKPFVIFGTGTVADIFYNLIEIYGQANLISFFIVSKKDNSPSKKFGIPVYGVGEKLNDLRQFTIYIAVQSFVKTEVENVLIGYGLRNYIAIDSETIMNEYYRQLYKDPIEKYKILGQNQMTAGYGCNPKYIFEELHRRDMSSKFDLVWSAKEYNSYIPEYIRQVVYGSHEYYSELATARIWIDNSRKSKTIRKRSGQIYIQTWHGSAPMKKVEADVEDKLTSYYVEGAKHDSELADLFISGSRFYTDLYKKSFWYNGDILESGLPRQDVFWRTEEISNKIRQKYLFQNEDLIVLYAPTFRDVYVEGCYDLDIKLLKNSLMERFGRKVTLLVSKHPGNNSEYYFKDDDYIFIDRNEDFEEILATADILISDYSGCVYDFSFTGRPVFLFQKDFEEYNNDRGFYFLMDEMPYICAHSNEELREKILSFDGNKYKANLELFMDKMGNYDDGKASERAVDYIIDKYF